MCPKKTRQAWKELMKLVENDEVASIIVKDMSRLGRDYLLVGQYTEVIFPSHGVRFIAVSNNVNSLYGDNDFTPFMNLFNKSFVFGKGKKSSKSALFQYRCVYRNIRTAIPETSGHETGGIRTLCRLI